MADEKIKVIIAKPGLDGHDRGAKVVARALVEAGMEVVYLGPPADAGVHRRGRRRGGRRRHRPVHPLRGPHDQLPARSASSWTSAGLGDRLLTGGGIIPTTDQEKLTELGVGKVFGPGDDLQDIVDYIRRNARRTSE